MNLRNSNDWEDKWQVRDLDHSIKVSKEYYEQ